MAAIVVIGTSQGGLQALRAIAAGLPQRFPAPVLVVQHVGAGESILPSLLRDAGQLEAAHVRNGEALVAGHIHVAPPDRHLLVVDGKLELSRGPRENFVRPAIDPLFRSAAEVFGSEAIGVVLTGRLNDGTSGLYEIKRRGGTAIVQDPDEAEWPSMPQSAVRNVDVDYCVPLKEIAPLLVRLAAEKTRARRIEGVAAEHQKIKRATAQSCPECGGAMEEQHQGRLTRFRCHIGHAMTAEVLAAAQFEQQDKDLTTVLRTLNERASLCGAMAEKARAAADEKAAALWQKAADEAKAREQDIQRLIKQDWSSTEKTLEPAD